MPTNVTLTDRDLRALNDACNYAFARINQLQDMRTVPEKVKQNSWEAKKDIWRLQNRLRWKIKAAYR